MVETKKQKGTEKVAPKKQKGTEKVAPKKQKGTEMVKRASKERKAAVDLPLESVGNSKYIYGQWRTDKPAQEGFSRELISSDYKYIAVNTNMVELHIYPEHDKNIDTIFKAISYRANKVPMKNYPFLGTRTG
jgi:hypothetical protein